MYTKTGTTILGVRTKEGGVILGLDRQSTEGNNLSYTKKYQKYEFKVKSLVNNKAEELITVYSAVAGYAAATRYFEKVIISCFEQAPVSAINKSENFFKTLAHKLGDSWFKETGLGIEIMTNSALIVAYKNGPDVDLKSYDGVGAFSNLKSNIVAVGSGKMLAIGSFQRGILELNQGKSFEPVSSEISRKEVEKAVRIAGLNDLYSGGKFSFDQIPVDVVELTP